MDAPEMAQGKEYLMTQKGMAMTGEVVLCLLALICKAATSGCFILVPIVEMTLGLFMLIVFSMGLDKKFLEVHWLWSDFFRTLTACPVILITSIVCLIHWDSAAVLFEIFAIFAGVLFGYDAWLVFTTLKDKRSSSGSGVIII
ncbi:hypothetical protein ACEWY4_000331 [Coilia grayii]|uniref:Proteolipid protein 2 n=1 Tax=Coilia grayii TaxID=363190 RepID=A0ABD1KWB9_9TELE